MDWHEKFCGHWHSIFAKSSGRFIGTIFVGALIMAFVEPVLGDVQETSISSLVRFVSTGLDGN